MGKFFSHRIVVPPPASTTDFMNLPNQLTILRLILTVVFVVLFHLPFANRISIALLVFAVASITDYLDGHIARSRRRSRPTSTSIEFDSRSKSWL